MTALRKFFLSSVLLAVTALVPAVTVAQDIEQFHGMEWRAIGPFNGGRGTSVVGHPTDPMVFWFSPLTNRPQIRNIARL